MADQKTLPCPFCGEQPEVTKHFKRDEYCLVHRCEYIPAHIDFSTMAGILKRWNARADPASPIHPCHASLVMPERKKWDAFAGAAENMKSDAFNNALDEVSRLNASLAAPSGWKLVPIEPTKEMADAAMRSDGTACDPRSIACEDYRAMLEAAPCSGSTYNASCNSKSSHADVANIHATALELCDVIENKNDLQLHKWALKSAYLVSKLRALLGGAP
ncbi:MAG: hypothetical protein RBR45_11950 [Pseudomonas sp.]|nr:hypothetical protein [Pseudomonas sp.]